MVQHFVRVPFISAECHTSVPSAIHQCRVPCVSAERMTSSLCSGGLWLDLEVMVRGNGLDFFHFTGELDCMLRSNIKITNKKLKENRCEVAGWPENIERVQILHLRACSVEPGFLVWLQHFFFFFFFLLQIWAFQGASLVHSLLAEIPALFMMLLIESTDHKMAALMVVFSLRSTVDFLTKRTRNGVTTSLSSCLILFLSIGPVIRVRFGYHFGTHISATV